MTETDRRGWLLTFTWGASTFRIATAPLTITDYRGAAHHFEPGLDHLIIGKALDSLDRDSIQLNILAPTDWPEIQRHAGRRLDGEIGELRRYIPGRPLEEMPLYARGVFEGVRIGERGSVLEARLRRVVVGTDRRFLDPDAFISERTIIPRTTPWEFALPEESIGAFYPLIIGRPRWVPVKITEFFDGVNNNRLIAAAGRVVARAVSLTNVSQEIESGAALGTATDALGRRYTFGELDAVDPFRDIVAGDDELFIHFDVTTAQGGGGIPRLDNQGEARSMADLLAVWSTRWFPEGSWDTSRLRTAGGPMASVLIDAYIDDPDVMAFEWLDSEVLPLLPSVWAYSERGVYLQAMDFRAPRHHARWWIDTTRREGVRVEDPEVKIDDVRNHFTLKFAPGQGGGLEQTARILAGPVFNSATARDVPSLACERSEREHGRQVWERSTSVVRAWSSAFAILQAWAARDTLPKTRLTYQGPPDWEAIEVGDVVIVTDPEIDVNGRTALVENVWVGGLLPSVEVVLLDE